MLLLLALRCLRKETMFAIANDRPRFDVDLDFDLGGCIEFAQDWLDKSLFVLPLLRCLIKTSETMVDWKDTWTPCQLQPMGGSGRQRQRQRRQRSTRAKIFFCVCAFMIDMNVVSPAC